MISDDQTPVQAAREIHHKGKATGPSDGRNSGRALPLTCRRQGRVQAYVHTGETQTPSRAREGRRRRAWPSSVHGGAGIHAPMRA